MAVGAPDLADAAPGLEPAVIHKVTHTCVVPTVLRPEACG